MKISVMIRYIDLEKEELNKGSRHQSRLLCKWLDATYEIETYHSCQQI